MENKSKGNLILFPHLFERYVDFALEARALEDYQKAKTHLEQALLLQSDDVATMIVLIVTYHDLGMYQEAKILAGKLLRHGLGEFTDVLRLYIISLIHLEQYEEVWETLTPILEEKKLTIPLYQEFQEILQTCELLIQLKQEEWQDEEPIISRVVQDKLETDSNYLTRLIDELTIDNFDRQQQAIEQLKYIENPQSIIALKEFLIKKEVDPVLKTFALGALKELGVSGRVEVYKWGKLVDTVIEQVPNLEKGLGETEQGVADFIAQKTYHEDPTFSSFALHLWVEYFFASYPLQPKIRKIENWAAALHYATDYILGRNTSKQEIAERYNITPLALMKCYQSLNHILNIENRVEN